MFGAFCETTVSLRQTRCGRMGLQENSASRAGGPHVGGWQDPDPGRTSASSVESRSACPGVGGISGFLGALEINDVQRAAATVALGDQGEPGEEVVFVAGEDAGAVFEGFGGVFEAGVGGHRADAAAVAGPGRAARFAGAADGADDRADLGVVAVLGGVDQLPGLFTGGAFQREGADEDGRAFVGRVVAEGGEAVVAAGASEAVDLVERLAVAVEADALEGGGGELEPGEAARGRGAGPLLGGAVTLQRGGVLRVVVVIVVFGPDGSSELGAARV